MKWIHGSIATALLTSMGAVPEAWSQSGSDTSSAASNSQIEEILVTARRREESLQEVPISTAAFTADEMDARSFASLEDLGQATANMKFDIGGLKNTARIFIRGVGQDNVLPINDPGVGVYLDGVYMGRMQAGMFDTIDLERIEVLRGPQGTLFGKNTTGGAINVVSAKPGPAAGGYIKVGLGNFDQSTVKLSGNLPLIEDTLYMRGVAAYNDTDGYLHNSFTGEDWMSTRSRAARLSVLYTPSEDTEFLLSADITRKHENGILNNCLWDPTPQAYTTGLLGTVAFFDNQFGSTVLPDFIAACQSATLAGKNWEGANNTRPDNLNDTYGVNGTLTWDVAGVQLKSITSLRELEYGYTTDIDGTEIDLLSDNDSEPQVQEQFSQEFQLSGISFDDSFNWVTGVHLFREKIDTHSGGCNLGAFLPCDLGPFASGELDNRSVGLFGEASWAVTERLEFTAGVRYTIEEKDTATYLTTLAGERTATGANDEKWKVWTPRFILSYDLSDEVMVYGSWGRGFKSGGLANATGRTFDPEFVSAFELGIKSDLLDQRLRINIATFYTEFSDMQLTALRPDPVTGLFANQVTNAASATLYGAELEIVASPIDGLLLAGGLGYTHTEYDEFVDFNPITLEEIDRSHLDMPHTPRLEYNLSASYAIPVQNLGTLGFRLDWSHRGSSYAEITNVEAIKNKPYGLLNGRISLALLNSGRTEIALWGKNLLDKNYIAAGQSLREVIGANFTVYAPPRTYGIEVKHSFGR